MYLRELTEKESGLIILKETGECLITNWAYTDGIPRKSENRIVGLRDGNDLKRVDDSEFVNLAIDMANDYCKVDDSVVIGIWENNEVVVFIFENWI